VVNERFVHAPLQKQKKLKENHGSYGFYMTESTSLCMSSPGSIGFHFTFQPAAFGSRTWSKARAIGRDLTPFPMMPYKKNEVNIL